MNIEIQYKRITIQFTLENDFSIKIESLKKLLRSSLEAELKNQDNIKIKKSESFTPQNKNISINYTSNTTIKSSLEKDSNYKEEIKELLNKSNNSDWKLYLLNNNNNFELKKDSDYIKNDSDHRLTLSPYKNNIMSNLDKNNNSYQKHKIMLTRVYQSKQKSNFLKELKEKEYKSKQVDLLQTLTGAEEKIKLEDKIKRPSLSDLIGNSNSTDFILNALMELNGEGGLRNTLFQNLSNRNGNVQVIVNGENVVSSSNTSNTNIPRSGLQNNILANLLSLANRRPSLPVQVTPNEEMIQQLLEMGFERERARRALIMTRNNLEAAVDVIANDQDLSFDEESQNNNNNNDEDIDIEAFEEDS